MSTGSKLVLLGLRESGKTTYLAALWHLLEAAEVPSLLTPSALQPDREYLNRIRDTWLAVEDFGRTSLRVEQMVSICLRDNSTGADVEITLPDVAGESFRLQWVVRKATRTYAEYSRDCVGLLMFIHPFSVRRAPLIRPSGKERRSATAEKAKAWSPDDSPTQVQLVELLQFIQYLRFTESPLRIAVIVSAWDVIRDRQAPQAWVERRLPLLSQFLTANAQSLPCRVYGVSALGGDREMDREALLKEPIPAQRIRVIEPDMSEHHDLTAPLRFLLALEGGPVAVVSHA